MNPITDISQLDLKKKYSYADYLTWQFDEYVELIKGFIYRMSPAPRSNHQRIAGSIFYHLYDCFESLSCSVFDAPFDVRLIKNKNIPNEAIETVVQPDICVICDESKIDEYGCIGAPDLIVEILSPNTAKKDYNEKFNLYEENEVKEYWIVSPEFKTIEVFFLKNGKYEQINLYEKGTESISVELFPELKIPYEKVFKGI